MDRKLLVKQAAIDLGQISLVTFYYRRILKII